MSRGPADIEIGTDIEASKDFGCEYSDAGGSIAEAVLVMNGINYAGGGGSSLDGLDIRNLDCLSALRMSLQAASDGLMFGEVYCRGDGQAVFILNGVSEGAAKYYMPNPPPVTLKKLAETVFSNLNNPPPIVVVQSKDPLPQKHHGGPISLSAGSFYIPSATCDGGLGTKNAALALNGWTPTYDPSLEGDFVSSKLKQSVNRKNWEEAVGYKTTFSNVTRGVSISISQTTPSLTDVDISSTSLFGSPTMFNTDKLTDFGGIIVTGTPILDVARGLDLYNGPLKKALDLLCGTRVKSGFGPKDYWVLLDNSCVMNQLAQGNNFVTVQGGKGVSTLRQGGTSVSWEAFGGQAASIFGIDGSIAPNVIKPMSVSGHAFSSISDILLYTIYGMVRPEYRDFFDWHNISKEMFDTSSVGYSLAPNLLVTQTYAESAGPHGPLIAGIGDGHGLAVRQCVAAVTLDMPSIQIKGTDDAPAVAQSLANGGINMTPLIVQDMPPSNAICISGVTNVYTPRAPDTEETLDPQWRDEDPLDCKQGNILEINAPWKTAEEISSFASNVYVSYLESLDVPHSVCVYSWVDDNAMPNMQRMNDVSYSPVAIGQTINSVEYNYVDRDSMTMSITTGLRYSTFGNFTLSPYIRKSMNLSRRGVVLRGSNKSGVFIVGIKGLGEYQAINGMMDPVFPGDHVEVNIMNHPVERE